MQLAQVIGHATATVKHASLQGWRMLIVQPLDARQQPDGVPLIALDSLGSGRGDRVIINSDGNAAQEWTGAANTPVRWTIMGVADESPAPESGAEQSP
jgi:ethanolamine utilization protein EutN